MLFVFVCTLSVGDTWKKHDDVCVEFLGSKSVLKTRRESEKLMEDDRGKAQLEKIRTPSRRSITKIDISSETG